MKIYACFTDQGLPVGFWNDEVFPPASENVRNEAIPSSAVEITPAAWSDFLSNPGMRRWQDGDVVEFDPPVEPIPTAPLTARQLRLGLVTNGIMLDQVEAAIAGMDDAQARAVAQIEWEYASQFNRNHPLIAQVGQTLGLSDDQIDDMWAASLAL